MDFLTAETLSHYKSVVKMIHYFLRDHACSPFMPEDESETFKPVWVKEAETLHQKVGRLSGNCGRER